jgi:hypothetical protein
MGISISFVYFSEFFPTSVRCIGLAIIFSMESVAFVLDETLWFFYIKSENRISYIIAILAIMTSSSIISLLLSCIYLPETYGKNLKDQIDEVNIAYLDNFRFKKEASEEEKKLLHIV